jgi:hypothetical protein
MKKILLALLVLVYILTPAEGQIDTNTVVYSWKLTDNYANHMRIDVDTLLINFQNYNPIFRDFVSVSTLGNYGLPAVSNVFTDRNLQKEFLMINAYYPFMKFFDNTQYLNTRKPFTKITYIKGGSNQNKEEILDAFHSQNLTKTLNFGLHYTTVGSLGQYRFQKVKNNSFNFFSSLSGKIYSYHFSLNVNKIVADENGGIVNDSLVTDTTYTFSKDIPTLFNGIDNPPKHEPDVYNEVRNINIFAMQEVAFRAKAGSRDSGIAVKKLKIFYPKLVYIFYLDRSIKLFNDKDPAVGYADGLYPAVLFNENNTSDSLYYWKLFNAARLLFQGRKNNHYFIDYTYEMMQYSMYVPAENSVEDTLSQHWFISEQIHFPSLSYNSRLFNSYLSSSFNRIFANHLELNLYGRYYLAGYRSGDFYLSGDLKLFAGKSEQPNSILIKGINEFKTPDFLYTHYASNNFTWTKNFDRTSMNNLSINLTISSKKIGIQGDYYLLRNLIFFNKEAFPEQYRNSLSVFVLTASKRFDFWKISTIGKLVYQKTDNERVLGLPEIAVYNSTYLTHQLNFRKTGGKLLTMIGFDMFYNTKYYADAYMPPLATFYRQFDKELGNYPYFDAFLNVQLKRLRFFLKMEHVNSGWINKNYFSVLHYPRNERNIKFGLSWTFYD